MYKIQSVNDGFFFEKLLSKPRVEDIVSDTLSGVEDGELFMEYCLSESLTFDDGILKNASSDISQGFGLRAVIGESTAYAHASDLSESAIKRASDTVRAIKSGHSGSIKVSSLPILRKSDLYYGDNNPLDEFSFEEKIKILADIDAYLRQKDDCVKQVSVSLSGEWQVIYIMKAGGFGVGDIRPLVRLNVSVIVEKNGRMERGSYGSGGRESYAKYISCDNWQKSADEALRQALVNLESVDIMAGEMDVVLGSGWPGILLHEAIGHGLEGDCNRKKASVFSELMGKRIAVEGVTIVDDGTIDGRRGSVNIDDEGTPSSCTTLIEDGILVGYMQDRQNARLMGTKSTGNGRRESFEHQPMPRMTNTYMLNGKNNPEDIIKSVKNGLYAVSFGGGQVDTTSGKFVFSASEAYKIEDGKITQPVKGATLIGNGSDVLTKIRAVGDDMNLDAGVGTCGKDGQSVPVGVGQPTLLIGGLTVGGTEI